MLINETVLILMSSCTLIVIIYLILKIFNKLVYLPIKNYKSLKLKEKQAIEKKLKKFEFDIIQFKNDIVRIDLEIKELKKVGKK